MCKVKINNNKAQISTPNNFIFDNFIFKNCKNIDKVILTLYYYHNNSPDLKISYKEIQTLANLDVKEISRCCSKLDELNLIKKEKNLKKSSHNRINFYYKISQAGIIVVDQFKSKFFNKKVKIEKNSNKCKTNSNEN